ncbi:MAG TPA: hypothetical protein PLP27_10920 [Crocinitomicaceae bacterium]|nr:hypothetical protein [Crocinitomicaceae bacterium]
MADETIDSKKVLLPYSLKNLEGIKTTTQNTPEQVGLYEIFLPVTVDEQEIEYEVKLHTSVSRLLFPKTVENNAEETVTVNYQYNAFPVVEGFLVIKYSQIKANLKTLASDLGWEPEKEEEVVPEG